MQENPPDRYRRPFLVQLTPADSELLDRLGLRHGTKRQAVISGLQLLDSGELEALRARVTSLEGERDVALAEAAGATQQRAEAATLREELKAANRQLSAERSALKAARADLRQAKQDLAGARRDTDAARTEAGRLAALVPHHAFCAACGKYVPEAEWAEQPDPKQGGVHLFHQPHGYRPRASLTQLPSVLFWRATPRETAE